MRHEDAFGEVSSDDATRMDLVSHWHGDLKILVLPKKPLDTLGLRERAGMHGGRPPAVLSDGERATSPPDCLRKTRPTRHRETFWQTQRRCLERAA